MVCASFHSLGVPVFLAVMGLLDADWRVAVACRDARIYTVKARADTHTHRGEKAYGHIHR
jgi:hypothetical protein